MRVSFLRFFLFFHLHLYLFYYFELIDNILMNRSNTSASITTKLNVKPLRNANDLNVYNLYSIRFKSISFHRMLFADVDGSVLLPWCCYTLKIFSILANHLRTLLLWLWLEHFVRDDEANDSVGCLRTLYPKNIK